MAGPLSHLNSDGEAHMVDVGDKASTARVAIAEGRVEMSKAAFDAVVAGDIKKGDVFGTARIAGIMAAKKTSELVPLCHPIALSNVEIDIGADEAAQSIVVRATAKTNGQTGVEMEALTAASVACLTVYDMAKAIDKSMTISDIRLLEKTGGKSGSWKRSGE
ncbi:MAG: cyclic pyranopterin monophosphate synthase MoaC [Pseudomonadota bacterium]